MAMKGRSLHREGKPRGCRVDLRGGAKYPKIIQSAFVCQEELKRWEAGLDGQHVSGGAHKAIGRPSLDLVPEHGEFPGHMDRGQKGLRAIAEDGKEEGGGEPMPEEGGKADPRRGDSFDRQEGGLSFG